MQQEPIVPQLQNSTIPPPTSQQDFGKTRRRDNLKSSLSTVLILIIAPIVALFLTMFVFQSYEVDGQSMETTLQNKDRLIVWKAPRTIARITDKPFIPARETVVIFIKHGIEEYDPTQDKQLIKRVIGLPGERVVVRNNVVTIYNAEHPEGFNPDTTGSYTPVKTNAPSAVDLVVPKDHVFLMGDNRPNSLDSRAFGAVPVQDIVGTLAFRIFPLGSAQSF